MNEPTRYKTTLDQWRILQAVVDYGGYAQAAEKLHRSHSTLNHAVNKLQLQLGVPLLEVQGRKAVLTKAGEVLLRRSRQLTQDAQELELLAESLDLGWEPEITLAVEIAYPRDLLFQTLKAFYPESRGTRIRVVDTVLSGSTDAVLDASADLVICAIVPRGYLSESLQPVEFLPVAHCEHPLVQRTEPLTQQELARALQIVISDTGSNPELNPGWLKAEQRWSVSSFEAAISVLIQGVGFCWLPTWQVEDYLEQGVLKCLQVKYANRRRGSMNLVVPRPDRLGPGASRLKELLLEVDDVR